MNTGAGHRDGEVVDHQDRPDQQRHHDQAADQVQEPPDQPERQHGDDDHPEHSQNHRTPPFRW
jgi:hypothetical protein